MVPTTTRQRIRRSRITRTRTTLRPITTSIVVLSAVVVLQLLLLPTRNHELLVHAQKHHRTRRTRLQVTQLEPAHHRHLESRTSSSNANNHRMTEEKKPENEEEQDCSAPVGPCERCTDSERIMIPEACMDTGKRQPFQCAVATNNEEDADAETPENEGTYVLL